LLLTAREGHGLAAVGDLLYVAGGWDGASPITSLRSVETLDLHAKAPQWIEGISMSHGRNGHGLASTGGRIFAVGGIDLAGKTTGTTESYSPGEDAWVAGPPLRTPRSFLGLAAMHGKLYAAGGYAANGAALSSVEVLARDSHGPGRWATLQCAMLSARASHGLAVVNMALLLRSGAGAGAEAGATGAGSAARSVLLAAGGFDGKRDLASTEYFDPEAGTWAAADNMTSVRSALALASIGGTALAAGGDDGLVGPLASTDRYTTTPG
jgi:kelch-like protein 17 (actinfilin)